MNNHTVTKKIGCALLLSALCANGLAATTDLSNVPLVTSSTDAVLPNIMFVLDDSGSMDWDYMPDDAKNFSGKYGFNANHCNGTYYDPGITYAPPVDSTGASYANASFSAAWKDGYNTGAGTVNLNSGFTGGSGTGSSGINLAPGPAFYYTYLTPTTTPSGNGTVTTEAQKNFRDTTGVFYRECNSAIGSTTVYGTHPVNTLFSKTRLASTPTTTITIASSGTPATITVSGNSNTTVSSIKVGTTCPVLSSTCVEILKATTSSSRRSNTVASNIASGINACTAAASGNCTASGYSATVSGSVVTLSGPSSGGAITITKSGSMGFATVNFPTNTATGVSGITVNGVQILPGGAASTTSVSALASSIASGISATGYSATASGNVVTITGPASASTYIPVITSTGGSLTLSTEAFPESTPAKLQNFANWYSYYSTRMLMMKTGAGLAFKPIDDKYRVGFLTINNNISPDIVENAPFDSTQKSAWYGKLYAANPGNSTPLRQTLANVGQYYAHKFGTFNTYKATITVGGSGSTAVDSITVNGTETMNDTSTASTSTSTVARNIATQINLVDPSDYGASASGSTITITGPASALGQVPVISGNGGGMTFSATAFAAYTTTAQLNGIAPADPVQYSCQQNFTILSTDGYWNGNNGTTLNGSSIGNQDGTEIRPMFDGSNQTSQTVTTTTTVERKQSVQNTTTTTPWTRTVTTVGAACSATATPAGAASTVPMLDTVDGEHYVGLGTSTSSTNPDSGRCYNIGTNKTTNPKVYLWFCRGSSGNNPKFGYRNASATDGAGVTWYVVSSGAGAADCVTDQNTFGSGYSTTQGACPATIVSGSYSIVKNQTYNELAAGTATTVKDYTTVVTSTVVTTNGQSAPPVITTSGPTVTTVSGPTTATTSDTGAPTGGTAWVDGSPTSTCMASPPPASTSAAVAGSASTTNSGAATETVLSTTSTASAPVTTTSTSGGTSNTLADVAEYYYVTDLRTSALGNEIGVLGTDVSENNVPSSGLDSASWQHMTTFTLGLGARGRMVFSPTYQSDTSGDFFSVKNGSAANPPAVCSWQTSGSGSCNWPTPASGAIENIDDLWHAAVNGRGTYFSATNPSTLATALSSALAGVSARTGASAAATTSNPNVTSGDNFVFSSTFTTQEWDGELVRQQLDLTTGVTSSTIDWTAQAKLDANATRNIYTYSSGAANKLKSFTWANLTSVEKDYFNEPAISTAGTGVSQFLCAAAGNCLSDADQTLAAGSNLVSFLRGDRTNEGIATDNTKYYRQRLHILGDIVNAEAVYVKASLNGYADFGHSAFVTSVASRQGMVYAAANDGMLHAFYAADGASGIVGGAEAWAYIPSMVLPGLYHLADKNYTSSHRYYVDGTPVAGEICTSNCGNASAVWKTILVGGLNGGGQGYYALDITDPATPKALWEFTDANMGYTYGNPNITKLKDGTWVVLVTSGYNNVTTGDGQGHLYVINAATGAVIRSISTGAGSVSTPGGLAKISAKVVNPSTDNTVQQVYGGDVLGNLWRFDVNGDLGPSGYEAQLLVTLQDASSNGQPMTSKPEIGIVNGHTVVYVGTGRYLGASDNADHNLQTLYAIRDDTCFTDPLSAQACSAAELAQVPGTAIYNNPRSDLNFVRQTQTTTTCPANTPTTICTTGEIVRTSTSNPVDMGVNFGWYVDLPDSGERANTDPTLALGTLGFTTNVPNTSACTIGGISYRYFLDYRTGAPVSSSVTGVASAKLGNALATRPVYVRLPNNTIVELTRLSDGTTLTSDVPIGASGLPTRRTSWRELTD